MRLIFLTSLLPVENPGSGFDIANRVIVDSIVEYGADIRLVGYATPGMQLAYPERSIVLGVQDITNARASAIGKLAWIATAFANRTTVSSAKMLACGAQVVREALERSGEVDGVILNSVQLPGAYPDLVARFPSIYIAHNVEWRTALENARFAGSPVEGFLFRRESRILKKFERHLCDTARFVWTLAEDDRRLLGVDADDTSAFLPLVTRTAPPDGPVAARTVVYDIGMIGNWSWQSNRIGLEWFLSEVAPLLPADYSIAIAGEAAKPPEIRHPGVEFLGRVADARDFVRNSSVMALTSRAGTGVQLKTIETFELGLQSVATRSALRGIAEVPANCIAADEPVAFAAALVSQVEEARRIGFATADGRLFHAAQIRNMRGSLARGLARLGSRA